MHLKECLDVQLDGHWIDTYGSARTEVTQSSLPDQDYIRCQVHPRNHLILNTMKTIYSMGKGKYVTLDSYGKTHQSNHLLKAVVAALILAASISTIAALASKYTTLDPQVIKADKSYVLGY
jgi:hypothetical protein